MVIVYHNTRIITEVYDEKSKKNLSVGVGGSIVKSLFLLSKKHPDTTFIWCDDRYKTCLNKEALKTVFYNKLVLASYSLEGEYCILKKIGYVEQTPYVNVRLNVTYPTWLMSSNVGGINTSVLNKFSTKLKDVKNFDYFLCSLAKLAMPKGILCYSEPSLIRKGGVVSNSLRKHRSTETLFTFVRQHYKPIWVFNLLVCFMCYEKRIPLLSFIKTAFKTQMKIDFDFNLIFFKTRKVQEIIKEYDVVIPTIGRRLYLYNVLKGLSSQTIVPNNVIIIEQNPNQNLPSELDYLVKETWPFKIKHIYVHKTGVCNARNIGKNHVESEWVFLGDDDIKFEDNLIQLFFEQLEKTRGKVVVASCLKPGQKQNYIHRSQTSIFGSGCSMLKSELLKQIDFDVNFEFGFGEDNDYGMQIRKKGEDIIYSPDVKIIHLKAPIGGFRVKHEFLWDNASLTPKPSPTVMLFYKKHYNRYQLLGAKYTYIVKFYKNQTIKNPFKYLNTMNNKWKASEYWSTVLAKKGD